MSDAAKRQELKVTLAAEAEIIIQQLEAEAKSREANLNYDLLSVGDSTAVLLRQTVALIEELRAALAAERGRAVEAETKLIHSKLRDPRGWSESALAEAIVERDRKR